MKGQTDGRPDMRTIGEWQGVIRELFSRAYGGYRCALTASSASPLIDDLQANFPRVDDSCYAGQFEEIERALVDCLVDLFVICDRLDIALDQSIAIKWPGACFYCGMVKDCGCVGRHGAPKLDGSLRSDLLAQPLSGWQQMLKRLFGVTNQARGVAKVSEHLGKEIDELEEAVVRFEASRDPVDKLAAMLECADVLAWLIAVANLLDIDLSYHLSIVYHLDRCPSCEEEICAVQANCPFPWKV
ncbi:MAG: hypothetical protein AAB865_00270 [Patescibacteria group bacterium]